MLVRSALRIGFGGAALCAMSVAFAIGDGVRVGYDNGERVAEEWREAEAVAPAYPVESDLVPFYVAPTVRNSFMIDARSISLGSDGVVRYTLVVRTPGGAENVTYEGIRCQTDQKKVYAVGRKGGEWAPSRNDAWVDIAENSLNRQHAALAHEYLCQNALPVGSVKQAIDNLRRSLSATSISR